MLKIRNLLNTLSTLRKKAVRFNLWMSLNINERVLIELILKNVKKVSNKTLAIVISRLIVKLINTTRYAYNKRLENIGKPILERHTISALSMGWSSAIEWLKDPFIIRWYGLFANVPLIKR